MEFAKRGSVRWYAAIILACLFVGGAVLALTSKLLYFTKVDAVIVRIDDRCAFFTYRSQVGEAMECARAEALRRDPDFSSRSLRVRPVKLITYRYTSPVDAQVHEGSYDLEEPEVVVGESIRVWASRTEPGRSAITIFE